MLNRIIPKLVELAKTSVMTSKHAAAIMHGKKVLSTGVNYQLPAADIIDLTSHKHHNSTHQLQRKYLPEERF